MKYKSVDCINCESKYTIEYGEDNPMEDEPTYCPFCGEDINESLYEDRLDDDFDDEEKVEDE
jgi:NAD-dependent SIR2 family protein deacetylase